MITHSISLRVRYADTDQMGYVYYGKYAEYFEVGRVELIRSLDISYREMEAQGIMLPVAELNVHYKLPAVYDELIRIETTIPEIPKASLLTQYTIYKESGEISVLGTVRLAFIDKARMRPTRAPVYLLAALEQAWQVPLS